jgi:dGTP triphosphohydrolase
MKVNRKEEKNDWLAKELKKENYHGCTEHTGIHTKSSNKEFTTANQKSKVDYLYKKEQYEMDKINDIIEANDLAEQIKYGFATNDDYTYKDFDLSDDYGLEYLKPSQNYNATIKKLDSNHSATSNPEMVKKTENIFKKVLTCIVLLTFFPIVGIVYTIITIVYHKSKK